MREIQKKIRAFLDGKPPVTAAMSDTVASVINKMRDEHVGCVLILDSERVKGIFTDRDVLKFMAGKDAAPEDVAISSVMTRDPECLSADDYITYAINMMSVGGFRNIPIVDADGRAQGVLRVRKVVEHLSELVSEKGLGEHSPTDGSEWFDVGGG